MNLSSENMEVISSVGTVDHLNVARLHLVLVGHCLIYIAVIIRKVEESFDSGLTMLGALTIHSVRKHNDYTRLDTPFGLSAADKVINHNFSSIHEVTKLSFPNNQRIRVNNRVTVLESEYSIFAEMTICDIYIIGDRFEEEKFVDISFLVADQGVTLRERSSFTVLP